MRPRVFPAEDAGVTITYRLTLTASMRPRVFPAEDLTQKTLAVRFDVSLQ